MLAGLRHGKTLGTPLALVVRNNDHKNWTYGMSPWPPEGEPQGKGSKKVTLPRPGHADLAGVLKYDHDDVRNALERASARHTAVHVAAGGVAKALLAAIGVDVEGSTVDEEGLRAAVDEARTERDTVGGVVEVRARNVPPGLGTYAAKEDRLDARLAAAVMGIQAVKGVEIGEGFSLAGKRGSEAHDEIEPTAAGRRTTPAGSRRACPNGEEIVVRAAMKPLPTLMKPLRSVDLATGEAAEALVERSDVAAVEALAVVAEAAVAWELARAAHEKFGGDSVGDFVARLARVPRAHPMVLNALDRHVVLIGFMGAGKTTLGRELARAARPRVPRPRPRDRGARRQDDPRALRGARGGGLPQDRGARRPRGARRARAGGDRARRRRGDDAGEPRGDPRARSRCSATSICDTAWFGCATRAGRSRRTRTQFRALYEERQPIYREVADAVVTDVESAVLAAAGVHHGAGSLDLLGELVPGDGPVALVADAHVMGIYGPRAQQALGDRLTTTHELPSGEEAKAVGVLRRLWSELRLDRDGTLVALGGGCTTDVAGFAAATYLRGVPWAAVPTTLVGQVDAAIGGKTAIDIPEGKNLVGAFHWPARVVIDERCSRRCPSASGGRAWPSS